MAIEPLIDLLAAVGSEVACLMALMSQAAATI